MFHHARTETDLAVAQSASRGRGSPRRGQMWLPRAMHSRIAAATHSWLGIAAVVDTFEQRSGEIAFARVGQHAQRDAALARFARHLECRGEGRAARDAAE